MNRRLLLSTFFAASACLTIGVSAAEEKLSLAMDAGTSLSTDTDGFQAFRGRVGWLFAYANPWRFSGVNVQSTKYTKGEFSKDVTAVLGKYRDQRRDNLAGVDIEAGVAQVSGHLRPVGDATLRMVTSIGTAVDLNVSADLVETPKVLDRGIGYTFLATGVEQPFGERSTITALAGWQRFNDGNARVHLRARYIWLAVPEAGITLQLRHRHYSTRQLDVGGAYFNPENYQQTLAVAAIRKRHAGWVLSGSLGAGQERVTGISSHPAYLAEVRGESPVGKDIRLVFHAGYYRSSGYTDSPDYAYQIAGLNLVFLTR